MGFDVNFEEVLSNFEGKDVDNVYKSLIPLLNSDGGLKNEESLLELTKCMEMFSKMTQRCIFLNILKATSNLNILERFLAEGGWNRMNVWLSAAKSSQNMDLVLEVLKMLHVLPLRIEHLRATNTGRIVKHFSGVEHQEVKVLASTLVAKWMEIVKAAGVTSNRRKKNDLKVKKKVRKESSNLVDEIEMKSNRKIEPKLKLGKSAVISLENGDAFSKALCNAGVRKKIKPVSKKPVVKAKSDITPTTIQEVEKVPTGEAGDFDDADDVEIDDSVDITKPRSPKLDKNGNPKKTVRWKCEEQLTSIRYFECEEGERVNVNSQSFKDAMNRDRMMERSNFDDMMDVKIWKPPVLIDLPHLPLVSPGVRSLEKPIQEARELKVLQSIFLTRDMIPDSPQEADEEAIKYMEPVMIPLNDAATEATTTAAVPVEVPEEVEPMNLEEPIDDQHFEESQGPVEEMEVEDHINMNPHPDTQWIPQLRPMHRPYMMPPRTRFNPRMPRYMIRPPRNGIRQMRGPINQFRPFRPTNWRIRRPYRDPYVRPPFRGRNGNEFLR